MAELLDVISSEDLVQALNAWATAHQEEWIEQIGFQFDVDGEVRATSASARSVDRLELGANPGQLYARVTVNVTFANRGFDDDEDLSGENTEDISIDIELNASSLDVDVTGVEWPARALFPD